MAQIKTITASTTEQAVDFGELYQFVWFRNLGEKDCYVSDHSAIVAGADGVALLKAGESVRIVPSTDTVYIKAESGTSSIEVHTQNFAECPSKSGGKSSGGGGSAKLDYSTTEQDTGVKWVDGKTIYQRTFELDYDEKYGQNWIICPTTDIDNLMRAEAVSTGSKSCLDCMGDVDIISVKIDDVWYATVDEFFAYVTFWYTKK